VIAQIALQKREGRDRLLLDQTATRSDTLMRMHAVDARL
jgi:hypothetical protein